MTLTIRSQPSTEQKPKRKRRRKSKSSDQPEQEKGRDYSIFSSGDESTKPRKKSSSLSNSKQASVFGPKIRL